MNVSTWQIMTAEDRREKVTKLANDGFSAGMIAQQIPGATRNSVMGYIARFKIPLARQPRRTSTPKERAASSKIPVVRTVRAPVVSERDHASRPPRAEAQQTPPDIAGLAPISKSRAFEPINGTVPVLLENIGARQCHWPVNGLEGIEPILCGAGADHLYCNSHKRLAYVPRIRGAY